MKDKKIQKRPVNLWVKILIYILVALMVIGLATYTIMMIVQQIAEANEDETPKDEAGNVDIGTQTPTDDGHDHADHDENSDEYY